MSVGQVIICGVRRGGELIGNDEFQQFAGRAGRKSGGRGLITILCPEEDEAAAWGIAESDTPEVHSRMDSIEEIAFHILPRIHCGFTEEDYLLWWKRTLASTQGGKNPGWDAINGFLQESECIDKNRSITSIGKLSVAMYIRPTQASEIISRARQSKEVRGWKNDSAHILSPEIISYISAPIWHGQSAFVRGGFPEEPLSLWRRIRFSAGLEDSEYDETACLCWMLFQNGEDESPFDDGYVVPKDFLFLLKTMRENAERMFSVVGMAISLAEFKDASSELGIWRTAVDSKTTYEIARTMMELSVSKNVAKKLHSIGIFSLQDYESRKTEAEEFLSERTDSD